MALIFNPAVLYYNLYYKIGIFMMPMKNSSKTEQIVDAILSYIIDHKLTLNDKLPSEEEMTVLFGVSRVCVREALRGLKFLGLVETGTRRGTRIRQVNFALLSRILGFQIAVSDLSYYQLLEARLAIELNALDIAAGKITREQLKELRGLAPEEIERNYQRDCEFHRALLAVSGNELLCSFSRLLEIFFNRSRASCAMSQAAAAEHQGILDALETHNLELARGIMRNHLAKYKGE